MEDTGDKRYPLITLDQLNHYLGLALDKDRRPEEGARLDFKDRLPADIGKDVAAMANTFGGTIIIGVSCEEFTQGRKQKHNIPAKITGETYAGGDAKLHITQRILATVRPRPSFTIEVVPVGGGAKHVAIIRVEEGVNPPYEYDSKSQTCIPVRVQDSSRPATLQDLETLFAKRSNAVVQPDELRSVPPSFYALDHWDNRSVTFLSLIARPRVKLRIRFDRNKERDFLKGVRASFFSVSQGIEETIRTGEYYQVEAKATYEEAAHPPQREHRLWALLQGGGVGFTRNLVSPTTVGDLAAAILSFFRLCEYTWSNMDQYGALMVRIRIECRDIGFTPRFPSTYNPDPEYEEVGGIHVPAEKSLYNADVAEIIEALDFDHLRSTEWVADCLLFLLRQTRGAQISFPQLHAAVERLSHLLQSNWQHRFKEGAYAS